MTSNSRKKFTLVGAIVLGAMATFGGVKYWQYTERQEIAVKHAQNLQEQILGKDGFDLQCQSLIAAIVRNDISGATELLDNGISPNCKGWTPDVETTPAYAMLESSVEMVDLLVARGANLKAENGHVSPFMQGLIGTFADEKILIRLIELGSDMNEPVPNGTTIIDVVNSAYDDSPALIDAVQKSL
jgi:hypothetical protein